MSKPTPKCLIVAGCPRSGTSMMMQIFAEAGLFLGNELVPSSISNQKGHYEDRNIVELHEGILQEFGNNWQHDGSIELNVNKRYQKDMEQIAQHFQSYKRNWGFKDPRVSLFLRDWRKIISTPKVVIMIRHYLFVARSLYRRHSRALCYWESPTDFQHLTFFSDPAHPLRIWLAYNRALLDYYSSYPDDCLIVPQDAVLKGWDVVSAVNRQFSLDLNKKAGKNVTPRLTDNSKVAIDFSWIDKNLREELDEIWAKLVQVSSARVMHPDYESPKFEIKVLQSQLREEINQIQKLELAGQSSYSSKVSRSNKIWEGKKQLTGTESHEILERFRKANINDRNPSTVENTLRDQIMNMQQIDKEMAEIEFCLWSSISRDAQMPMIRLAIALIQHGRMKKISKILQVIENYSPMDPWHHFLAYRWFWQAGAYDAAILECRKTLELDDEFWQARAALFYSCWALSYREEIRTLETQSVFGGPANMLLWLSQLNAKLGCWAREQYYYYAGAMFQLQSLDHIENLEKKIEQAKSDQGRLILWSFFVEHTVEIKQWWKNWLQSSNVDELQCDLTHEMIS